MSESEAGLVAGQAEEVGEVAGLHSEETAQHQQSAGTGNTAGTGDNKAGIRPSAGLYRKVEQG